MWNGSLTAPILRAPAVLINVSTQRASASLPQVFCFLHIYFELKPTLSPLSPHYKLWNLYWQTCKSSELIWALFTFFVLSISKYAKLQSKWPKYNKSESFQVSTFSRFKPFSDKWDVPNLHDLSPLATWAHLICHHSISRSTVRYEQVELVQISHVLP